MCLSCQVNSGERSKVPDVVNMPWMKARLRECGLNAGEEIPPKNKNIGSNYTPITRLGWSVKHLKALSFP